MKQMTEQQMNPKAGSPAAMSRVAASPSVPARAGAAVAPFARGPVIAVGAFVTVFLIVVAGRYGYHRDELYFLVCGRHLAWGYPDQPPLAPVMARAMSAIAPGSLTLLRAPSAICVGLVVVLAGLTAREMGARRDGQIVAAVVMASGGVVSGAGHPAQHPGARSAGLGVDRRALAEQRFCRWMVFTCRRLGAAWWVWRSVLPEEGADDTAARSGCRAAAGRRAA